MSARQKKFIGFCVVVFGTFVVTWAFISASPSVSMTVLGFTAKQWPDDVAQRTGSREYIVATIELTNASRCPISYWASGTIDGKLLGFVEGTVFGFAEYTILHH